MNRKYLGGCARVFRFFDFQCTVCNVVRDAVIEYPQGETPPKTQQLTCFDCQKETRHERLISMPAEYHGEKVLNPVVSGGSFDTAGKKQVPTLPDLPRGVAETTSNYRQLFSTSEYREAKREREAVKKENAAKQDRLKKLRAGANINMRRDKLPGDPKITA
jgi:hypothetical protein